MQLNYFENAIIYNLPEINSTNDWLKQQYKVSKLIEGSAVSAGFQTQGRGQRTNVWESEKDKNLLCSVLLKPEFLSLDKQFYLSMAVALAVYDVVSVFVPDAKVKWPNDIYIGNRKIGGILIENSIMGNLYGSSVVGLGLNINQLSFSAAVPNATSLALNTKQFVEVETIYGQYLEALYKRYNMLKMGMLLELKQDYLAHLFQFKEWRTYEAGGNLFEARIIDVLDLGTLMCENIEGEILHFGFKEIVFVENKLN